MSEIEKEINFVKESGLFSANWYFAEYPDVKELKINPIRHYLWIGASMGRNPSPDFDTSFYLSTYPQVSERGINPLVHYITEGKKQGNKTGSPINRKKTSNFQLVVGNPEKEEELQQENELLLLQLHQVQEELEKYYLKYQDMKNQG